MLKLKPCPFCGVELKICESAVFRADKEPGRYMFYGLHPDTKCFCRNYKIQEWFADEWNRRANDDK